MDVQVPVDTGTDTGASSTGAGPQKGLSASCSDIVCKRCNVRIWHDGQPFERIRMEMSRHVNLHNGRCRPDGNFKPAKEAKMLVEQMIINQNLFEVRGARECDFLRREDAKDSHECSSCTKLFATFDQADHHCNYTRCKVVRPPPRAVRIHCHVTVGGTLVRAVGNARRRLDDTFSAVPMPITPAANPIIAGQSADMPPPPAAPVLQHNTDNGKCLEHAY